jgi:hypothetical protein
MLARTQTIDGGADTVKAHRAGISAIWQCLRYPCVLLIVLGPVSTLHSDATSADHNFAGTRPSRGREEGSAAWSFAQNAPGITPSRMTLIQMVAQSGYESERIDDSTWRVLARGEFAAHISVFVTESNDSIGFVVKVADRQQLRADASLTNSLLSRNGELARAKLVLSPEGDLLLTSSGSLRLMDLKEFRALLVEVIVSADNLARDLRNGRHSGVNPPERDPALQTTADKLVEMTGSSALGPRRKGLGGPGRLAIRPGAIAYQDDETKKRVRNEFSASCEELLKFTIDEELRTGLRVEMQGQAYLLFPKNRADLTLATALVTSACKKKPE